MARDVVALEVPSVGRVEEIGTGLASSPPSRRDTQLGDLGGPLASVMTAAAAIGAAGTCDAVSRYVREQGTR